VSAAVSSPQWLTRGYAVALVLHAITVVGIVALSFAALGLQGTTANAAREGGLLLAILFLSGLVPALPSAVALISWWLCRRRGWTPSAGHMWLVILAAAVLWALFLGTFFQ
jgi:hypothetical protein